MIYDYKCDKCNVVQEIKVKTWDLQVSDGKGMILDNDALDERINEPRGCECGGNLMKRPTAVGSPLMFSEHRGARTQRFR